MKSLICLILLFIPLLCIAQHIPTYKDYCELVKVNNYCILKCSTKSASDNGGIALIEVPGDCRNE